MLRGRGGRCWGYVSDDGTHCYCTRQEHAGLLPESGMSGAYRHWLEGRCDCGVSHAGSLPQPVLHTRDENYNRGWQARSGPMGDFETDYIYEDEQGAPLYRMMRYRNPKSFRQQRYEAGQWKWGVPAPIRRVPFKLAALLAAPTEQPVYVTEGEKDCLRLLGMGYVATTNANGPNGWCRALVRYFRGRDVIIVEHNDHDGVGRTNRLVTDLSGVARRLRVAWFPDTARGFDLCDWLDSGRTVEELTERAYGTLALRLERRERVA